MLHMISSIPPYGVQRITNLVQLADENKQARSQDLTKGGATWRAAGKNFLGGFLMIFQTMFGLVLQWYLVVFITFSMHTIKANLFNKCVEAFKGVLLN